MKYGFALVGFFISLPFLHAAENFPKSCKPLVIKTNALIIKSGEPLVVLINNRTKNDLWLVHPSSTAGAQAGWTSRMETDKWTALVVNKKTFTLHCIESRPGHEQEISCQEAVAACAFSDVKPAKKMQTTRFAGENLSLATVLDHLGENGFKW